MKKLNLTTNIIALITAAIVLFVLIYQLFVNLGDRVTHDNPGSTAITHQYYTLYSILLLQYLLLIPFILNIGLIPLSIISIVKGSISLRATIIKLLIQITTLTLCLISVIKFCLWCTSSEVISNTFYTSYYVVFTSFLILFGILFISIILEIISLVISIVISIKAARKNSGLKNKGPLQA